MDNDITQTTRLLTLNYHGERQRVFIDEDRKVWWCYHDVYHILALRAEWWILRKIPACHKREVRVVVQHTKSISQLRNMVFIDSNALYKVISKCTVKSTSTAYWKWIRDTALPYIFAKKEVEPMPFTKFVSPVKEENAQTMSLVPLKFEGNTQNVFYTPDGRKLWRVRDACKILGIANYRDVLNRIPILHVVKTDVEIIDKLGRKSTRKMSFVDAEGLIYLIVRSNKPEARRRFQEWALGKSMQEVPSSGNQQLVNTKPAIRETSYLCDRLDHIAALDEKIITGLDRNAANDANIITRLDRNAALETKLISYLGTITEGISILNGKISSIDGKTDKTSATLNNLGIAIYRLEDAFNSSGITVDGKTELEWSQIPYRFRIQEIMRKYYESHPYIKNPNVITEHLFYSFKYMYDVDLPDIARNKGKDVYDVAEDIGVIAKLYGLAMALFVVPDIKTQTAR